MVLSIAAFRQSLHLPLLKSSLMTASLIVFVEVMKELPATLILRPFGVETLATYFYQYAETKAKAVPENNKPVEITNHSLIQ